ncbi:hypothetical protein [Shouchella miscanthi]|uniref:Uncharacterized protein n=1 Tax=Shouchella miscanthi TaxID=2598861 RepID=A0ABU6NPI5_9BACI|nr:hypothetical protein [Shouchella miscanthi]
MKKTLRTLGASTSILTVSLLAFSQVSLGASTITDTNEGTVEGSSYSATSTYLISDQGGNSYAFTPRLTANSFSDEIESYTITPSQTIEATGLDVSIGLPPSASFSLTDDGGIISFESETYDASQGTASRNIERFVVDLSGSAVTSLGFNDTFSFNFGSTSYDYFTSGSIDPINL